MQGKFIEVTSDEVRQSVWWKCSCFKKTPPLVSFALVSFEGKTLHASDLVWMDYSDKDSGFTARRILPLAAITISVQHKEGTITLQLDSGKSYVLKLYRANLQDRVLLDWEALSHMSHEAKEVAKQAEKKPKRDESDLRSLTEPDTAETPETQERRMKEGRKKRRRRKRVVVRLNPPKCTPQWKKSSSSLPKNEDTNQAENIPKTAESDSTATPLQPETVETPSQKKGEKLTGEDLVNTIIEQINECVPTVDVAIDGVTMRGLFDSKASASMLHTNVFYQYWTSADLSPLPRDLHQTFCNANGFHPSLTGYFVADVTIGRHTYYNKVFVVTMSMNSPLILGMNIIKDWCKDVEMITCAPGYQCSRHDIRNILASRIPY
ncbi:uncharacterized protein [Hyperolius riggenbachi]|uniref:uncharacterized protein n=1 Tax=Hyperolius riggenbachi TaxID=752182 RepID=UPI0035A3C30A